MVEHAKTIAIVGGGPAGLFAAENLARAGFSVSVYDHKPTLARKFLMAGRGGLNITHSENIDAFIARYGDAADWIGPFVRAFTPADLRTWCEGLGEETFVGSSGRVFPRSFKASPLLRAWLDRLGGLGVTIHLNHRWDGWDDSGALRFTNKDGDPVYVRADAVLLALGGASWPKLGSDAAWVDVLRQRGVLVVDFAPANCGFVHAWSAHFAERFAGEPVKGVSLKHANKCVLGDMMITAKENGYGIEGGVVYALSSVIRDDIAQNGSARVLLDLRPGLGVDALAKKLSAPRARASLSTHLKKAGGLSAIGAALVRELGGENVGTLSPRDLAALVKSLPLDLTAPFGLPRAISAAGGVARDAVDDDLMAVAMPGVFIAGEMLDWEAPTGGYLLQASFATAHHAAAAIMRWLSPSHGQGTPGSAGGNKSR